MRNAGFGLSPPGLEAIGIRRCSRCGSWFRLEMFYRDKHRKGGRRKQCSTCMGEWTRDSREKHRENYSAAVRRYRLNHPDLIRTKEVERRERYRIEYLIKGARTRAGVRGLPFDLDDHVDELRARLAWGYCELTDTPFRLNGGLTWDSPSIDRIVPAFGYVLPNVRLIIDFLNRAMGTDGLDRYLAVADAVRAVRARSAEGL